MSLLIAARREEVLSAYDTAIKHNNRLFLEGNEHATSEYVYSNQKEDACKIINIFYKTKCRVVSIQKKTKVGADGLMIEIAKLFTTHSDDKFIINPENVRIITGMSNVTWERDMIDKAPSCFKQSIFHHGKLAKSNLDKIINGLIIIDEIDSGSKEFQRLHKTLIEANMLDTKYMIDNNIRFVFISATMIRELYQLYQWGNLHQNIQMTIPDLYIGHKDFLELGIIKEFYPLNKSENINKWIQEDIIDNYATNYKVHFVRVTKKNESKIEEACIKKKIKFIMHTSDDKISTEQFVDMFKMPLMHHIVIGVKDLLRRANLIPNQWKIHIGAIHERYVDKVDHNVQVQGLVGRMTGYWKDKILKGHKTGPFRTSIKSIEEYENNYIDPFGINSYQAAGFKKREGAVASNTGMLSHKNVKNLNPIPLPITKKIINVRYLVYKDKSIINNVCKKLGYGKPSLNKPNIDGFIMTSTRFGKKICSKEDAINEIPFNNGRTRNPNTKRKLYRSCFPCYENINDNTTVIYIIPIRDTTTIEKINQCISKYKPIDMKI